MQPTRPRLYALIPCAGSGSRAGTAQPKQYQPVAGRPMVLHTLAAFAGVSRLTACLIAVAPDDRFGWQVNAPFLIAHCGGSTRAATVLNGLTALQEQGAQSDDWVLVHDAARCLVTPALIDRLIDACIDDPVGGLLAHKLADTLKSESGGRVAGTVDRSDKWLAQTPQMFRIGPLQQALGRGGADVTDEASAMESLGLRPLLIAGNAGNFKVTYPEDFAMAEALLGART